MAVLINYGNGSEKLWVYGADDELYITFDHRDDRLDGKKNVLHSLLLTDEEAIQLGKALTMLGLTRRYLRNAHL